jgi:ketosteroid isomerase-like protein
MPTANLPDLVRKYFAAYETKDRAVVDGLLSDDFTFTSPRDDHIGRAAYFERCWPNSANVRTIAIEKLCENGPDVFVRYCQVLRTGAEFRNVELLRFESGKLTEVDVYFGRTIREAPQEKR